MVINATSLQRLSAFLGTLPPSMAADLAAAVERARLAGESGLPHEAILTGLRPVLRRTNPPRRRVPTPMRLAMTVVEDLFTQGPRRSKQPGRIAREVLTPLWHWLHELMPEACAVYETATAGAILLGDQPKIVSALDSFHAAAAQVLTRALEEETHATKVLGGPAAFADAREIALIFRVAPRVRALQETLPRPIETLDDTTIADARVAFDRIDSECREAAVFVPLIVMARLVRPWEALRLTALLARRETDTLIAQTDMGIVGDLLFADAQDLADAIAQTRLVDLHVESLLQKLEAFVNLTNGMVHELGIRRDGRWGQTLMKLRAAVAEAMEGLLERAPREIAAALPAARGQAARQQRKTDFSRWPDPEKASRAEKLARFLTGARPFAPGAAFATALKAAADETAQSLRHFNDDMLRELRTIQPDERDRGRAFAELAATLVEALMGEEEAALLRRRAKVALG